nr:hypothetical protein [Tanacetum cinerariifolium]
MYHKKNVDFADLLLEDFVYQVDHKDAKKSNEIYYPRFTKVIINFFMTKDPSIPRRNKFGAMSHVELTNEDIKNSTAYKEYYAIASGATPPKTKESVRKTHSSSDTTMPPPTAVGIRLSTSAKGKQPAKSYKAKGLSVLSEVALTEAEQIKLATKRSLQQTHISQASGSGADEGTCIIPGVPDVPTYESDEEISWKSSDEDDDDDVDDQSDDDDQDDEDEQDDDDQNDNDDDQDSDNDGDDFVHPKLSTHDEEVKDEESFDPIVKTLSQVDNSDDESNDDEVMSLSSQFVMSMLNPSPDTRIDSFFESTHQVDVPVTTTVVPLLVTTPTLPPPSIPIITQVQQAPAPSPTTALSTSLQELPNFGSLYIYQRMNEDVKVAVQLQSDRLEMKLKLKMNIFLNKLDENIQKIIKEQVKIILDTYGDTVTLKRCRDDKDKDEEPSAGSDQRSKRRREGKEPELTSAPKEKATKTFGKSTEGSKSHQKTASKSAPPEEPMQTTQDLEEPAHLEFKTGAADIQPTAKASQHPKWFQKQSKPPTPDRVWNKTFLATHRSIQPWISDLAKKVDSRTSFNKLMDTPMDFSAFLMNRLKVDTLTPELLVGPTYKMMKRSCKSLVELEFFLEEVYKATTDQSDWNNPEGQQYPHNLLKPLPLIPNSRGRRVIPFDHFINNDLEYLRGGASSRKIIAVTELQIVEWHNYKHLDWITMRRDDDKLYKLKEGDLKRLHIQDIKDMLLILVQGKMSNLTVEERFAFNVSLRMFTKSIVI